MGRGIVLVAELRQDIVTGQWVVVATERAMRPTDFRKVRTLEEVDISTCPFCPGNESSTPPEAFAVRPGSSAPDGPGWSVRVVPNMYPAFEPEPGLPSEPLFPRMCANGTHEVIIHTPDHDLGIEKMSPEEVRMVLSVYRQRMAANYDCSAVKYVHIIVNYGRESGASLEHPHSQLFGVPLVVPLVGQELGGSSRFMADHGRCVFCAIVEAELEAGTRVVAATEEFVAIAPFASRFPFEVWLIPKEHGPSFEDATEGQLEGLASLLKDVLLGYASCFSDPPYNYYIHTAPHDGQPHGYYHWHLEMFPKLTIPGSFELGTSMMINITTPEHAAAHLAQGQHPDRPARVRSPEPPRFAK